MKNPKQPHTLRTIKVIIQIIATLAGLSVIGDFIQLLSWALKNGAIKRSWALSRIFTLTVNPRFRNNVNFVLPYWFLENTWKALRIMLVVGNARHTLVNLKTEL